MGTQTNCRWMAITIVNYLTPLTNTTEFVKLYSDLMLTDVGLYRVLFLRIDPLLQRPDHLINIDHPSSTYKILMAEALCLKECLVMKEYIELDN